jgi:hypothetical protein
LIAALVVIAIIALHIPTQARAMSWLTQQRKLVEEERALAQ